MLPRIPGLYYDIHYPRPVHGSAIYARGWSVIKSSTDSSELYRSTLNTLLSSQTFTMASHTPSQQIGKLCCDDFKSHSTTWGYCHTNNDGEAVEESAPLNDLTLHSAEDQETFQCGRWRRVSFDPDQTFVTSRHNRHIVKSIVILYPGFIITH